MLIGLDLDNTLADHTHSFLLVGREMGLLADEFGGSKSQVKAHVLATAEGERAWMRLQGQVYGPRMDLARPYPGVLDFLRLAERRRDEVHVISHRTRHGHFTDPPADLHLAARRWLRDQGLVGAGPGGLTAERVTLALSRDEKIARIRELAPDWFIDDLRVVLEHPDFPARTRRILFSPATAPEGAPAQTSPILCTTWSEIAGQVFHAT